VGDLEGTLRVILAVEDPTAGEGGAEASAEDLAALIEEAFYSRAAGGIDTDEDEVGLHGVTVAVADYFDATFLYHLEGVDDPPLELVERGLAQMMLRISVVGPVCRAIPAPPTDPHATLETTGIVEDIIIDRIYE